MPDTITWNSHTDKRTIDVQVTVLSEEELQRHTPQAVFSPIVNLVNLAACGGLSGSNHSPQDATARIITYNITDRRVQWLLEFKGVAPTVLQHIEGALSYFDTKIAHIDAVSVSASPSLISAREQVIQSHFMPLPFRFFDDRQEYSNLQIDISFEAASRKLMDRVEEEAFGVWISAASAGCFCYEGFPPEICKVYLGENQHGVDTLTLGLDKMILPEPSAVDSLLNTLTWAHHHITPISRVEFYD